LAGETAADAWTDHNRLENTLKFSELLFFELTPNADNKARGTPMHSFRERHDLTKKSAEHEDQCNRLTREALADVNAGRVIDAEAVVAWADRLADDAPLVAPR
jgi:hypothetical protein